MFDRLPYNFTESERKRRQPEALANLNSRQSFANRRSSQDKEAVALSGATSTATVAAMATGGGASGSSSIAARRSVELDAVGTRADERGGR